MIVILCALFGPTLLGEAAVKQNLRARNLAPFDLERGWMMILGADALGRPVRAAPRLPVDVTAPAGS